VINANYKPSLLFKAVTKPLGIFCTFSVKVLLGQNDHLYAVLHNVKYDIGIHCVFYQIFFVLKFLPEIKNNQK
jgi:hypothetical protein